MSRSNAMPLEQRAHLWRRQEFYRALSTVNAGRMQERDFFEGLTQPSWN